jgi:lipid II:glycine glycyltransferase (peptidoglycan interpeptide bridge formation enzyme)
VKTTSASAQDAAAWDRMLEAHGGSLLQSWTWGELQSRFGWRVERLWFDDGSTGLCSLQLTPALVPAGTVAYVPRGPAIIPAGRQAALEELTRRARAQRALTLRVEPEAPAGDAWSDLLPATGWKPAPAVQPLVTSLVDLRPGPDQLRASFKPKTRYNLGLSERKGVSVSQSPDVPAFARLSAVTARRQQILLPGADYYRALLDLFGPDRARLYLASHDNVLLAGILVARFGRTATYLFGGSSDEGRELMPNYLLHWRAMLDFKALGCEVYDWWGIPDNPGPDHPWAGLYRFKTGFGGTTVRYVGLYERALRPLAWRLERRLRKLKRRPTRTILG